MPAKQCHICSALPVPTTQACRRLRELKSLHCPRIFSVFFLTFLFLSLVSQGHKATAITLFARLLVPTITVQTSGLFLLKLTKKGRFQRGERGGFYACLLTWQGRGVGPVLPWERAGRSQHLVFAMWCWPAGQHAGSKRQGRQHTCGQLLAQPNGKRI